jgi:AcrR family transcriptional regulator
LPSTPSRTRQEAPFASLRDEKKFFTREAMINEGMKQFYDRGYDETTLEDICAEVRVSIRTLLRYFNSKEQLALARNYSALNEFRESIATRPAGVSVLEFWRLHTSRYARQTQKNPDQRRRRQLVASVPVLYAKWLTILRDYEDLLTLELAQEAGTDVESDLSSRLTAVMLVWGNEACARRWADSRARLDLEDMCLEVVSVAAQKFGHQLPAG